MVSWADLFLWGEIGGNGRNEEMIEVELKEKEMEGMAKRAWSSTFGRI